MERPVSLRGSIVSLLFSTRKALVRSLRWETLLHRGAPRSQQPPWNPAATTNRRAELSGDGFSPGSWLASGWSFPFRRRCPRCPGMPRSAWRRPDRPSRRPGLRSSLSPLVWRSWRGRFPAPALLPGPGAYWRIGIACVATCGGCPPPVGRVAGPREPGSGPGGFRARSGARVPSPGLPSARRIWRAGEASTFPSRSEGGRRGG